MTLAGAKALMTYDAFWKAIMMSDDSYPSQKFLQLPREQQIYLYQQAMRIMPLCNKMGPTSALELLMCLGTWLNQQSEIEML